MNERVFSASAAVAVAIVIHSDICTNKSQTRHLSWAVQLYIKEVNQAYSNCVGDRIQRWVEKLLMSMA